MNSWGRCWSMIFLVVGVACGDGDDPVALKVSLRTDYLPGAAFDEVRVLVSSADAAEPFETRTIPVDESRDYRSGLRVLDVEVSGERLVDVQVSLWLAGALVATREVQLDLGSDANATVVITCPASGQCWSTGADAGPRDAGVDPTDGGEADAGAMGHLFPARDLVCVEAMTPCATTEPARSEADRRRVLDQSSPDRTLAFILDRYSIPRPSEEPTRPGFNLDGLDSGSGSDVPEATCEEEARDYGSALDPLHVGVDNAASDLVPTFEALLDASECPRGETAGCLDAVLQQAIWTGELLIVIEISGIDSMVDDPEVQVGFYLGRTDGGLLVTPDGSLEPDQTLTTIGTIAAPRPGDIFQGRVRVTLPMLAFPNLGDLPSLVLGHDVDGAEVRFDIGEPRLANGQLGGSVLVESFVTRADELMPGIGPTVRSVIQSAADIEPVPEASHCNRISVGHTFEGVRVNRVP